MAKNWQSQQPLHFRDHTQASFAQQLTYFIFVAVSVLQLEELKPKAWKGAQDLMVLHLRPCWRDDEALAEDIDAQGSLHVALHIQDLA